MDNEAVRKLIQELILVMEGSKLSELEVEVEGARIRLQKESAKPKPEVVALAAPVVNGTQVVAVPAPAVSAAKSEPPSKYRHVTSPMVGTFYATPSPDADPYVEVGDILDEETVVCIIEAMKVMNEIKAEMQGKLVEVLVNNGEPVEYGQPLFLIDPAIVS